MDTKVLLAQMVIQTAMRRCGILIIGENNRNAIWAKLVAISLVYGKKETRFNDWVDAVQIVPEPGRGDLIELAKTTTLQDIVGSLSF